LKISDSKKPQVPVSEDFQNQRTSSLMVSFFFSKTLKEPANSRENID
jgi:hypothetical protein